MSGRFNGTKQLFVLAESLTVSSGTAARVDGGDLIWFNNQDEFEESQPLLLSAQPLA